MSLCGGLVASTAEGDREKDALRSTRELIGSVGTSPSIAANVLLLPAVTNAMSGRSGELSLAGSREVYVCEAGYAISKHREGLSTRLGRFVVVRVGDAARRSAPVAVHAHPTGFVFFQIAHRVVLACNGDAEPW